MLKPKAEILHHESMKHYMAQLKTEAEIPNLTGTGVAALACLCVSRLYVYLPIAIFITMVAMICFVYKYGSHPRVHPLRWGFSGSIAIYGLMRLLFPNLPGEIIISLVLTEAALYDYRLRKLALARYEQTITDINSHLSDCC